MYNKIFAAVYNMFPESKSEKAVEQGIWTVILSLVLHILSLSIILRKYFGILTIGLLPNKYLAIPLSIAIIFIVYKYYSKTRIEQLLKSYSEYSSSKKKIYQIVAVCSVIVPLILITFLA